MARVAINALGCEPGVESHDNIPYFSCSRIRDPLTIHRQHGELQSYLLIIPRNNFQMDNCLVFNIYGPVTVYPK
jgi:hypothetical protein